MNVLTDPGGAREAPPESKFFHFLRFSAKSLPNNRLAHPLWKLAPPLEKILDPQLEWVPQAATFSFSIRNWPNETMTWRWTGSRTLTLPHMPFLVDSFLFENCSLTCRRIVCSIWTISWSQRLGRPLCWPNRPSWTREKLFWPCWICLLSMVMSIAKKVLISNYCNFTSMYRQWLLLWKKNRKRINFWSYLNGFCNSV